MNLFKNISIFRDQLCNCFPWSKDTKKEWESWPNKEATWQPRLDYRELNDDPELKPTPFPNKYKYDMDYKYLLEENDRLERLVKCLILQMSKEESPLLDKVESLLTEKEIQEMALSADVTPGGVDVDPRELGTVFSRKTLSDDVDRRPDTATIFPRETL